MVKTHVRSFSLYKMYKDPVFMCQVNITFWDHNKDKCNTLLPIFSTPSWHHTVCTRVHLRIDEYWQSWWVFARLMGNNEISYILSLILMGHCVTVWHPSTLMNLLQFWHSLDLISTRSHCCDRVGGLFLLNIYIHTYICLLPNNKNSRGEFILFMQSKRNWKLN